MITSGQRVILYEFASQYWPINPSKLYKIDDKRTSIASQSKYKSIALSLKDSIIERQLAVVTSLFFIRLTRHFAYTSTAIAFI